jgi:hypothetical protein
MLDSRRNSEEIHGYMPSEGKEEIFLCCGDRS